MHIFISSIPIVLNKNHNARWSEAFRKAIVAEGMKRA